MPDDRIFSFNIALSVLNHLGRNLYRNFITILGEAISNSWDADAEHVWITVNKEKSQMIIIDDGVGMTADDFQNRFLRIGYSKRKEIGFASQKGRPFIGAKGIGKLALLSCAKRVTIISKALGSDIVGGTIDNAGLDQAIVDELSPSEYPLIALDYTELVEYTLDLSQGTILIFDELSDGIRNTEEQMRKLLALHFQFSTIDQSFSILFNGSEIGVGDLSELVNNTQFIWKVENCPNSPLISAIESNVTKESRLEIMDGVTGFIASVVKPSYLNVRGLNERVSIDLIVKGRLRERNLLNKAPSAQNPSEYVYGQIYFDNLDDGDTDPFTSSREGVKADNEEYGKFVEKLGEALRRVYREWDQYRIELRQPGDPENPNYSPKSRAARDLASAITDDYKEALIESETEVVSKDQVISENQSMVSSWIDDLQEDAEFNFSAYADCFISENLLRKYAEVKGVELTSKYTKAAMKYRNNENENLETADMSLNIRRNGSDLSYLDMDLLVSLIDTNDNNLHTYGNQYKPVRDATMHTSLLTSEAKEHLSAVFRNIKTRILTKLRKDEE